MVRHIVLWKLTDTLDAQEKATVIQSIQKGLEGLLGTIPGLTAIRVLTDALPGATADLMLETSFESEEALRAYSVHPAHLAVALANVRPYIQSRLSFDCRLP